MRPCIGIVGHCPPLCTMMQLEDGTYTLANVKEFHNTLDEILESIPKELGRR
jgi:hypothetical protein